MTFLALLALASAWADPLPAWEADTFGNGQYIAGQPGWTNGYTNDPWYGQDGYAYSTTDDSVDQDVDFGVGTAIDNWLIHEGNVGQGTTEVALINEDDDTIGIVACHDGEGTFYLVAHSRDSAPPPLSGVGEPTIFVLRVQDGSTELVGSVPASLESNDWTSLSLDTDDGTLTVRLGGVVILTWADPNPLAPGMSGFYAYNSGYDGGGGGNTNAYFDSIRVSWSDEDDDTVADDTDNCEEAANPGQEDSDHDGLGDACDAPPDTGGDADTDADTDSDDDHPFHDEDVIAGPGCGCSQTGAGPLLPGILLLLGLTGLRRRR
jgi:uncharacterized protein (TIGR03382 family)